MASSVLLTFRPAGIVPCAAFGGDRRHRIQANGGGGGGGWWAPLFGWAAEADYIGGGEGGKGEEEGDETRPARRFAAFTEEKARELRMRTRGTESFHDAMYHSAIASRLAYDLPRRA